MYRFWGFLIHRSIYLTSVPGFSPSPLSLSSSAFHSSSEVGWIDSHLSLIQSSSSSRDDMEGLKSSGTRSFTFQQRKGKRNWGWKSEKVIKWETPFFLGHVLFPVSLMYHYITFKHKIQGDCWCPVCLKWGSLWESPIARAILQKGALKERGLDQRLLAVYSNAVAPKWHCVVTPS